MDHLPIIIGGFFRTGTSLVRRLLDSHSHIHCGPEVKFFKDFYGDYLKDRLAHVRLFSTARSFGLAEEEILTIFGSAFIAFHERAAALAGKARWADKNPENVLHLNQWRTLLPEGFLFLHIVRHPLDALASLKEVGFPRTVPESFEEKVRLYGVFRQAGERYCEQYPTTCHTLLYEDLVSAPQEQLSHLFAFLGERYEPTVLQQFCAPERGSGIEDPKVARTDKVHTDSIGRWRKDLTGDEVQLARELLSPIWT